MRFEITSLRERVPESESKYSQAQETINRQNVEIQRLKMELKAKEERIVRNKAPVDLVQKQQRESEEKNVLKNK